MTYVRVPKDRIAVLIGHNGETHRLLEQRSGVRFEVDSAENEVLIHDEAAGIDPLMALKLQDIVKAIGRGFSPERAMKLFSDDVYFELVDIHDYVQKGKEHVRRVTSRLIGSEGKTRRIIEETSECQLAIYGHTVGIIGELDGVQVAKQAVDMILNGAEHASVYRFLEGQRRAARRAAQQLW